MSECLTKSDKNLPKRFFSSFYSSLSQLISQHIRHPTHLTDTSGTSACHSGTLITRTSTTLEHTLTSRVKQALLTLATYVAFPFNAQPPMTYNPSCHTKLCHALQLYRLNKGCERQGIFL